jgi:UDP-N-acetylglucosamine 3-dehydrogenase
MKKELGVAIVGMGFMGRAFAQICSQMSEARLVGVTDVVEEVGRKAAGQFGVPYLKDSGELISQPDVQAVIVATSEENHVAPSVLALEQGKGVLVEKPIADSLANARKMAAAAEKSKAPLMVGHSLRFSARFAMARKMIDDGQIGQVQYVQTRRLNGKGAQNRLKGRCSLPLFLGVHDYDVVRWYVGSEPVRVYAQSQFGVLKQQGYDVEDSTLALFTFENGTLGNCETGWILPNGHPTGSDSGVVIQGDKGRINIEMLHQSITLSTEDKTSYPDTDFMPWVHGEMRGTFVHEVRHFLACVRDGKTPLITANDAIVALQMAEAVIESARTNQTVQV